MCSVALCVPVFSRTTKVRNLLKSAERQEIESVYVADDGEITPEKEEIYNQDYNFGLKIIDLPFDAGVGKKRNELVRNSSEDFLFFIDSDMTVPANWEVLVDQLSERDDIGGITPMYLEESRTYTVATNLYEEDDTLIRDIRDKQSYEMAAGSPLYEFDFLPQVGIFRAKCVNDYNWDPNYTIMREHIDFFVGHWKNTDWAFGLSPSVYIPHFPGGDDFFTSHRESNKKFNESNQYFLDKWGYENFHIRNSGWINVTYPNIPDSRTEKLKRIYKDSGTGAALRAIAEYGKRKIRYKDR